MRWAHAVDANHRSIIRTFEAMGCSVRDTHALKDGGGDCIVGIFGLEVHVEIKDPTKPPSKQKLTEAEQKFHATWKGRKPVVVRTPQDCEALVSRLRGAMTSAEVHHPTEALEES